MHKKIMAAHSAGWFDGAGGKPMAASKVPGFAACVAAYTAGWAKGWLDMAKYKAFTATLAAKGA